MKINILLPFKEKFDEKKASSVSITVKNNLNHSHFIDDVKIFGQKTQCPLFKKNFYGIKYSLLTLRSKNYFLVDEMIKIILNCDDKHQIIEMHNRPYLLDRVLKKTDKFPITLFFHNDPKTMRGSQSIVEREKILEKCAAIFCVSKFIRKQFLDGIKMNHNKVYILHNGVDRKIKKLPLKKKEVLFVGRLVLEKGVDLYIESVSVVAKMFPDWNFGLIGSYRLGDNNNTNSYAHKVIKKFEKIGDQAKFYGFKDHDFVQQKMKDAALIIIPSLWSEPFGLVAAEAMSNGIAIIASKVGGIPEIIKKNGILIQNIDLKKLEIALIDLMSDQQKLILYQKKAWDNFKMSSEASSQKLDKHRKFILRNHF